MLRQEQKQMLLDIARKAITKYLEGNKKLEFDIKDDELNKKQGAFVTLKKNGRLRGCIGIIESDIPLYKTVSNMVIQSATGDPRFPVLTKDELKNINIEISVISRLEEVKNINSIEIGKHGLIIRQGMQSGLLLPQVATEYNWNRKQFLENTCYKAGLSKDVWKEARVYKFFAEVFSEEKLQ